MLRLFKKTTLKPICEYCSHWERYGDTLWEIEGKTLYGKREVTGD